MTHCPNIEHFSFVSDQSKGCICKTGAVRSDITDIICLSEGVPVNRTPLKQLVTTKAGNFKRFPLLLHPVESLLVPIALIYALFKTHQKFEVQVNKSSKTSFQTLGNSIIF